MVSLQNSNHTKEARLQDGQRKCRPSGKTEAVVSRNVTPRCFLETFQLVLTDDSVRSHDLERRLTIFQTSLNNTPGRHYATRDSGGFLVLLLSGLPSTKK